MLTIVGAGGPARSQPPSIGAVPSILGLQPSQAAAFRDYRDAEAASRADQTHEAAEVEGLNAMATPQRLDALLDQLRARESAFQRHAAATKAFYAVLSPEQRAIFDRMTQLPPPPPVMRPRGRPPGLVPQGDRLRMPPDDDARPLAGR